nr:Scr1 family TA system antitoxin-like transcriptional regulator [Micromonospora sp. NBC_00330]
MRRRHRRAAFRQLSSLSAAPPPDLGQFPSRPDGNCPRSARIRRAWATSGVGGVLVELRPAPAGHPRRATAGRRPGSTTRVAARWAASARRRVGQPLGTARAAGAWGRLSGPFNSARGADGGWVGHIEHQIDGLMVDGDHEVATLLARWEMIRNGALSRRQSIELMKEVVTSWT